MNIYLVKRKDKVSYNDYDSFVCIAEKQKQAIDTHPAPWHEGPIDWVKAREDGGGSWVNDPDLLLVDLIGKAPLSSKPRVVCASFNAG